MKKTILSILYTFLFLSGVCSEAKVAASCKKLFIEKQKLSSEQEEILDLQIAPLLRKAEEELILEYQFNNLYRKVRDPELADHMAKLADKLYSVTGEKYAFVRSLLEELSAIFSGQMGAYKYSRAGVLGYKSITKISDPVSPRVIWSREQSELIPWQKTEYAAHFEKLEDGVYLATHAQVQFKGETIVAFEDSVSTRQRIVRALLEGRIDSGLLLTHTRKERPVQIAETEVLTTGLGLNNIHRMIVRTLTLRDTGEQKTVVLDIRPASREKEVQHLATQHNGKKLKWLEVPLGVDVHGQSTVLVHQKIAHLVSKKVGISVYTLTQVLTSLKFQKIEMGYGERSNYWVGVAKTPGGRVYQYIFSDFFDGQRGFFLRDAYSEEIPMRRVIGRIENNELI